MNISLAIMAHPKRELWVPELEEKLPGAEVVWDKINDRWDTGRRSLAAFDPAADYHVVIQDDALVPENFMRILAEAMDNLPADGPVGLYFGKTRPRQATTARLFTLARKHNASWIRYPGPWWGVGIAVPTKDIGRIILYGDARTDIANYDLKIARYYQSLNKHCNYTFPSLVDHRTEDNPSLVPGRTGKNRRAYFYVGSLPDQELVWTKRTVDGKGLVL